MRKTKIVCTIGPASNNEEILRKMIAEGMNVARLNFSHGLREDHKETIKMLKKIRLEQQMPLGIMLDTKGPEIRLGNFVSGVAVLRDGASFTITTKSIQGDIEQASVSYTNLPEQIIPGTKILIDDGAIELRAETITMTDIICTVIHGGMVKNHKSVNVPDVNLTMEYMSSADKLDILLGIEQNVDFIAASFVRRKEDIIALRNFIDDNGGHAIKLIAKIENKEGVENFDEILSVADGIMIARGDMGVEVDFERLPGIQKSFIRKCCCSGKMVITATQMLESMIHNPRPTRAEITDVANAVFDGTSALMLSGETAAGSFPVATVATMAKIAQQAEHDAFEMNSYRGITYEVDIRDITNAVCDAACTTARDIHAKAIITVTKSGKTARAMSKFRPLVPIVAATPERTTYYQLSLSWGVYPVIAQYKQTSDELFLHAVDCARMIEAVNKNDIAVLVAGIPLDTSGNTNIVRVLSVE